ncbi:MAG: metallophosphoesterase [Acidobacteriota bacterium]
MSSSSGRAALRGLWCTTAAVAIVVASVPGPAARSLPAATDALQFIFTSDAHYGLKRAHFRGLTDVPADVVNQALVDAINRVPASVLPADGGLGAGYVVGGITFLAHGGDIANREERLDTGTIQPAAVSWAAFVRDYDHGLTLLDASGARTPLYAVPGNHDASNALGFHHPMEPATDATAMQALFERYMTKGSPDLAEPYRYQTGKVRYARDISGIHFVFLTIWPDSETRAWLETELTNVAASTPVVIVTHDQPDTEAKHFTNPNGTHDINSHDLFENLLSDQLADGPTVDTPPVREQAALEAFLGRHPNITAYFHGNSNWNQFYDWVGPHHSVALHTFRVDSPMKGALSAADETRLSFQVVTIDPTARLMTVRECLWNTEPVASTHPLAWGSSTTVALQPRP